MVRVRFFALIIGETDIRKTSFFYDRAEAMQYVIQPHENILLLGVILNNVTIIPFFLLFLLFKRQINTNKVLLHPLWNFGNLFWSWQTNFLGIKRLVFIIIKDFNTTFRIVEGGQKTFAYSVGKFSSIFLSQNKKQTVL